LVHSSISGPLPSICAAMGWYFPMASVTSDRCVASSAVALASVA